MDKKILVIDDSPTSLGMIIELLRSEGYNVIGEKTGQDGLAKAQSVQLDLVIIDTLLPDIDGFEVCRRIRETSKERHLKVIIITGSIDAVDAVKARRMGADDYRVKTADLTQLIEAAKEILK